MKKYKNRSDNLFIETQLGIVTRTGDWFHTTSDHIEQFVPGLLKKRDLQQLIEEAMGWVRSADTLGMTILLVLLLFLHPIFAAVVAVTFHFFWYRSKSAFVTIYAGKVLKLMNTDGYMLISALLIISYLGMSGQYLAVVVGLVFFFLMKLSLLKKLWDKTGERADETLSLNDRVFKMILIKYAMHYNIEPPKVKRMEQKIVNLASSRKEGSNPESDK